MTNPIRASGAPTKTQEAQIQKLSSMESQVMPSYNNVHPALKWRHRNKFSHYNVTTKEFARSFSVEELPHDSIPRHIWPNVRAFRKLRMEERYRMVRRYLQELLDLKVAKAQAKKQRSMVYKLPEGQKLIPGRFYRSFIGELWCCYKTEYVSKDYTKAFCVRVSDGRNDCFRNDGYYWEGGDSGQQHSLIEDMTTFWDSLRPNQVKG